MLPLIAQRLAEKTKQSIEHIKLTITEPLMRELQLRFIHLTDPCIAGIGSKVAARLVENLQAFKQVPAVYRMTNRQVENAPSAFLTSMMNPLVNLSE